MIRIYNVVVVNYYCLDILFFLVLGLWHQLWQQEYTSIHTNLQVGD